MNGKELLGLTVGGSVGGLGFEAGYSSADHQNGSDVERYGFFVSYGVSEGGTAYVEYENASTDAADGTETENDYLLLGYEQTLGAGVAIVAEFMTPDEGDDKAAVALVVGF